MKAPLESVTISGTAQVGQTLTATIAPDGATASCQWKSSNTSDGSYEDIGGATESSFVLTESENGKYIKVEATGNSDYTGTVVSQPTSAVQASSP